MKTSEEKLLRKSEVPVCGLGGLGPQIGKIPTVGKSMSQLCWNNEAIESYNREPGCGKVL